MPRKDELAVVNAVEYEFSQLADDDWKKLDLAAEAFCRYSGVDSKYLLLEAIDRVLDGRRKWPVEGDVTFRAFLCGVMRSIHGELVKKKVSLINNAHEYASQPSVSSEEEYSRIEYERKAKKVVNQIYAEFDNDEDVTFILVGRDDGLKRREIMEQAGMDAKRYNTASKRLRRYLDTNYPLGKRYE